MAPLLVVTVVNIVSVPLFYRFLGPEMYALWFYVLTFTGAFGFMDLGLGVAVGRYIGVALGKGDLDAVREYWGTGNAIAIPLLAAMAVGFAIVGVIFGPKWFNASPTHVDLLRWSFVAGGAGLFLSYYCQFWLILSQAHLDFRFLAIVRTAFSVLQVVPSIPLAWMTRSPLVLIFWATVVAALQLAVLVWHGRSSYRLGFSVRHAERKRGREMAVYTGKTFVSLVMNSLLASVDRLVLGRLAPPVDFARYVIAANVGSRILGLGGAVMGPVFSNTNRAAGSGKDASLAVVYNEAFDFTLPWYTLISVWAWLWHPVFLRIWLGENLGASVAPLFSPIIIACCFTAIANISTAQLASINRVGITLFFGLSTCVFLVVGVSLGWRWHGVAGVAWAFLLSRAIPFAQDLFLIRLVKADGWLALRTWKHIILQAALGLGLFSTVLFTPRTSLWHLIPALTHAGVVGGWLVRHAVRNIIAGWTAKPASQFV